LRNKDELSGILNWCIDGLQLYREEGLKAPAAVVSATETYRTDSDKIGNFIKDCLEKTGKNSSVKSIYELYDKWCSDNEFYRRIEEQRHLCKQRNSRWQDR